MFCSKCGAPLINAARFCANCGNMIAPAPQAPSPSPSPAPAYVPQPAPPPAYAAPAAPQPAPIPAPAPAYAPPPAPPNMYAAPAPGMQNAYAPPSGAPFNGAGMSYNDYIAMVGSRFSSKNEITLEHFYATQFYSEKMGLTTKLKLYSFVSYLPFIAENDIVNYSNECLARALNDYKGLPRGFQNGVGSFNVLVSERVTPEAIIYAKATPKKHFAAFEMPIVYDLSQSKLYYFEHTPMWGAIYYKFIRKFIAENFNQNPMY